MASLLLNRLKLHQLRLASIPLGRTERTYSKLTAKRGHQIVRPTDTPHRVLSVRQLPPLGKVRVQHRREGRERRTRRRSGRRRGRSRRKRKRRRRTKTRRRKRRRTRKGRRKEVRRRSRRNRQNRKRRRSTRARTRTRKEKRRRTAKGEDPRVNPKRNIYRKTSRLTGIIWIVMRMAPNGLTIVA